MAMNTERQAVVVGAGMSGLAAALRFHERGWGVTVLESAGRLGGAIETHRRDGFLMEAGPDSFITEKPAALALIRRLGLLDGVIGTNPTCRRSFILSRGRLVPIPEGFYLLAPTNPVSFLLSPLLSWSGKFQAMADLWLPRGGSGTDESLASFVRRRFGTEMFDRLAQPLVAGIYTADAEKLSLRATFPRFLDLETKYRSVILGLRTAMKSRGAGAASGARYGLFATMRDGLDRLVEAVVAKLPADSVRMNHAVTSVVREGAGWRVEAAGGSFSASAVVLALPGHVTASLLAPVDAESAALLRTVPYASSVTVNLAFPRSAIRNPLDGFGFVVPKVEGRRVLACTYSNIKFPVRAPADTALLRVFMGGATDPGAVYLADDGIRRIALAELGEILGITGAPSFALVHRHRASMPQYEPGHVDRMAELRGRIRNLPGLALAGNAFAGIGLPDVIASGESAADEMTGSMTAG